jgi:hypothetical protein
MSVLASSGCPVNVPDGVVMVALVESGNTTSELPTMPASICRGADKSIAPGDVALESGVKVPVIGSVWPEESCCNVTVIVMSPSGIVSEKVSLLTFQMEPAVPVKVRVVLNVLVYGPGYVVFDVQMVAVPFQVPVTVSSGCLGRNICFLPASVLHT